MMAVADVAHVTWTPVGNDQGLIRHPQDAVAPETVTNAVFVVQAPSRGVECRLDQAGAVRSHEPALAVD